MIMGLLRIGFLVNFLSHPVLVGFTAAAAIVIGFSQVKHVLGFSVPRGEFIETVHHTVTHLGETNFAALTIGVTAILLLLFFKNSLPTLLSKMGLSQGMIVPGCHRSLCHR